MGKKGNLDNIKRQVATGLIWKFLEKVGAQGMQIIIQIVLARLLLPEEYGLVGLLTIFITISDVFISQGLTTALIQKQNAEEIDFSSVFFMNVTISILIYAFLYILAPYIAIFYNEPKLTNIMRVLSVNVIIGAFPAVHNAILSRNLDFKKSFFRNITNVLTQGIVGITLAMHNFGAWAMVYGKIAGTLIGAIVLCITVNWYPHRMFSLYRIKILFSFSSKVLGANLLNTFFNNIHSLIIGHYYTATNLGYYQRGQTIPQAVMTSIDGTLSEVLYPSFSKFQNDLELLKKTLRRSIRTSMYIVLPILFGIMATSKSLTIVLLTDKWLPSVPFMQLSCVVCMFWPLSHRTHALNAIGKSNVTFILSLISKGVTLIVIFACVNYSIYAILYGTIMASAINMVITSSAVKKYIGYTLGELMRDIFPSLVISGGMCAAVSLFGFLLQAFRISMLIILIGQIVLGIIWYILLSKFFNIESFNYLFAIIQNICRSKMLKR